MSRDPREGLALIRTIEGKTAVIARPAPGGGWFCPKCYSSTFGGHGRGGGPKLNGTASEHLRCPVCRGIYSKLSGPRGLGMGRTS